MPELILAKLDDNSMMLKLDGLFMEIQRILTHCMRTSMDFLAYLKSEIRICAYLSQHRPHYGIVTAQQLGMTV